jgi:hypothetical protein
LGIFLLRLWRKPEKPIAARSIFGGSLLYELRHEIEMGYMRRDTVILLSYTSGWCTVHNQHGLGRREMDMSSDVCLQRVVQALDDLEMWALVGLGKLRLNNAHDAFDESSC